MMKPIVAITCTVTVASVSALAYRALWRVPAVKPPKSVLLKIAALSKIESDARDHLLRTIYSGSEADVRKELGALVARGYDRDAYTRWHLARYFASKHKTADSIEQLAWILDPPQGYDSTLQTSGEVMALWLDLVSPTDPTSVKFLRNWIRRRDVLGKQVRDDMEPAKRKILEEAIDPHLTNISRVYLSAAQELEASGSVEKMAAYYKKARSNSPDSYSVMHELGVFWLRHGDGVGGRRAFLESYRLAPAKTKSYAAKLNELTADQVREMDLSRAKGG